MKKYKHITIERAGEFGGYPIYTIENNKSKAILGDIAYNNVWKCYVASFDSNCIFSASCLRDIIDFIDNHAGKEENQ